MSPPSSGLARPERGDGRPRDSTVDTLRGVAILWLMLEHATLLAPGADVRPALVAIAERMGSGVQLFFVLSGYVVVAALERSLARGEGRTGYLLRRAAKIVPLYFLFLNLNIALYLAASHWIPAVVFPINSPSREWVNPQNYLAHLLFLQGFTPRLLHSLLDGSWSVVCEVYFYVSLLLLVPLLKNSARAFAGFAVSLLIVIAYTMTVGRSLPAFGYYTFPAQLPCFVLGIACWRLRVELPNARLPGASGPWLAASLLLLFFGVSKSSTAPLGIHMMLIALYAAVLMLWDAATTKGPLTRALQVLGQHSYSLFFLHLLLLKAFYVLVLSRHPDWPFPLNLTLNLFIAVLGSWSLSWLVFDRFDRYWVRLADSWLCRRSAVEM